MLAFNSTLTKICDTFLRVSQSLKNSFMYDHYDALIFDMDGTLIESGKLHEFAWIEALKKYDIPVDRSLMQSLAGVPTHQTVVIILQHFGIDKNELVNQVVAAKEAFVNEHKFDFVKPTKLIETAKQYHGKKPMAVGTGATKAEAMLMLSACEILPLIDHVVGADDVRNHKPAPDTFLLGAKLMNVAAEKCIVFEDSQLGIEAAQNANMAYVNVQSELGIINEYFL